MNNEWILEFFEGYISEIAMDGILTENCESFSILDEFMNNDTAMTYVVSEMINMTEALNLNALKNNNFVKGLLSKKDQILKTAKEWFDRQMIAFNVKKAQWLKAANDKIKIKNKDGANTGVVDYTEKKIATMKDSIIKRYQAMKQKAQNSFNNAHATSPETGNLKGTPGTSATTVSESVSKIFIENVLYGV